MKLRPQTLIGGFGRLFDGGSEAVDLVARSISLGDSPQHGFAVDGRLRCAAKLLCCTQMISSPTLVDGWSSRIAAS